jgi:hypothetical protein
MTGEDLDRMEHASFAAHEMVPAARQWLKLWHDVFEVDGFNPFDTLAVAYVAAPENLRCEELPVIIRELPDDRTEARMQGTKVAVKPYLIAARGLTTDAHANYCFKAYDDFKRDLMERLTR